MERKTSYARNMVAGSVLRVIDFFANALLGLVLMPFILHALGDRMYGLWIFVGSFIGYYGLMDFGLNTAVRRFLARSIELGDRDDMNRVVNTSLAIFSAIGALALAASFVAACAVPRLVPDLREVGTFRTVIFILGVNFAVGFPLRVFTGVLAAHMRYDLSTLVDLLKLALRTACIVVLLGRGHGIVALASATAACDILGYAAKVIVVRRLYPALKVSRRYFATSKVRTLFGYSVYTFVSQIADQLRFNIDNLVIAAFLGLAPVTLYSIGSRLVKYFTDLMGSALGITVPLFSQYEARDDFDAIREKYLFLTKVSAYLALLIGGTLVIFGRPFILAWVGDKYADAYRILLILLIPQVIDVMQIQASGLLYGLSRHKYYTVSNSIEALANLALSLVLVRKYGIYGVALGTAIPMVVIKVFVQPVYTCRVIGLPCIRYYRDLMAPVLLLSGAVLGGTALAVRPVVAPSYGTLLPLVCGEFLVFAAVIFFAGFSAREKRYLADAVPLFLERKRPVHAGAQP